MSGSASSAAFRHGKSWRFRLCETELSTSTKMVAVVMSLFVNDLGLSSIPSSATVARLASVDEDQVTASLRELYDAGWIEMAKEGVEPLWGIVDAAEFDISTPEEIL